MLQIMRKNFVELTERFLALSDRDQSMVMVGLLMVGLGCIGMPQTLVTLIRCLGFVALGGFLFALFLVNGLAEDDETKDEPEAE
jgi:hypothetical protein